MASLPSPSTRKRALFVQKWSGFVSAIWLSVLSGCYVFPNYSTGLKEVLAINQKLLNGLCIARVVGDSIFGLFAGMLSNYLPIWTLFCISAVVGFLGYGVDWLVVSRTVNPLPYWVMFFAETTAGSAVCWMNVAIFNASVRNFARNRGPVSGLFKGYMGLSAAVFFIFCDTLFSNSAASYLLMMLVIPTAFCLVSAVLFKPVSSAETQEEEQAEQTSLHVFNCIACGLAVYIAMLVFLPTSLKESLVYKLVATLVLIAILGAPALVPLVLLPKVKETEDLDIDQNEVVRPLAELEAGVDDEKASPPLDGDNCPFLRDDKAVSNDSEENGLYQPLLDMRANSGHNPVDKKLQSKLLEWLDCNRLHSWSFWRVEELGEEKPTLSLFKTWHYYVLYFSLFCGCGAPVTFSNNLGQVGQSFGFTEPGLFASLFSLGNFFGRLASGNISECSLRIAGMPRPAWLGLTKVPMISVLWWLSTGSAVSLYAGSPVLGFCLGCLVTLTIPIVSEFYGLQHFGTNFTLTTTYFLTGAYVFSTLAGYLYDHEAMTGEESSSLTCDGAECFGITFRVMACCLTIALVCDAVLTIISRPLYQKLKVMNNHLGRESKINSGR